MRYLNSSKQKSKRTFIYSLTLAFGFLILLAGFFNLQILHRQYYLDISIHNVIRQIKINPVRGLIRDKEGRILVDNRPAFSAALIKAHTSDSTIQTVAKYLNLDVKEIKKN